MSRSLQYKLLIKVADSQIKFRMIKTLLKKIRKI
jgi:hypothetical protein